MEFEVGDYVWAVLTKDHFSVGDYNKLSAKKIGPVEIVEKINPNAYRLNLPSHIRTADVFNVKHLIPYVVDSSSENDDAANSRANFLHPRGNDAEQKGIEYGGTRPSESTLGRIWKIRTAAPCLLNWAGRSIQTKTQHRDANHGHRHARNRTGFSYFGSGQFQGFLFRFLCVF